jgi:hypothetical protein
MGFEVRKGTNSRLDIYRRGHPVGLIRGPMIEFHGSWSRGDAERAMAAVRDGVGRWLSLQRFEPESNRRLAVTPLSPEPGRRGFAITLPPEMGADQVLNAARVACSAAFGRGTRYCPPRDSPSVAV